MNDILKELREVVLRTKKPQELREARINWGMGIVAEAGEVCDEIKKYAFHDKGLDREKLIKELGDVLWYLQAISIDFNIPFTLMLDALKEKMEERHPNGFDPNYHNHPSPNTELIRHRRMEAAVGEFRLEDQQVNFGTMVEEEPPYVAPTQAQLDVLNQAAMELLAPND